MKRLNSLHSGEKATFANIRKIGPVFTANGVWIQCHIQPNQVMLKGIRIRQTIVALLAALFGVSAQAGQATFDFNAATPPEYACAILKGLRASSPATVLVAAADESVMVVAYRTRRVWICPTGPVMG